jgi:hypothetical protein
MSINSIWVGIWGWGWLHGVDKILLFLSEGTLFIDLIDAKKKELVCAR